MLNIVFYFLEKRHFAVNEVFFAQFFLSLLAVKGHFFSSKCYFSRYSMDLRIPQKVFPAFDDVSHLYLMRGFQKYARNWVPNMTFWDIKRYTISGNPTALVCFVLFCPQKTSLGISFSCWFLQSTFKLNMKNTAKYWKDFLWYSFSL